MNKKLINPEDLYNSSIFGMSQAVIDNDSKQVFISGQVAWNKEYEVTDQSIEGQFKQALKNLELVLRESNSSILQLLQVRIYIKGNLPLHMEKIGPILLEFLNDSYPAVTGIGVNSMASENTLVEIEAIAKIS